MPNHAASAFRLISRDWDAEILAARSVAPGALRIICPFIKKNALSRLLRRTGGTEIITRFDLNCFNLGVSDLEALRMVVEAGGRVRGIRHLHSKLYLFGGRSAIATSANVTDAAFRRNHEFGFLANDPEVVAVCAAYFQDLWKRAGADLSLAQIGRWEKQLKAHQRAGAAAGHELPDYGADVDGGNPFLPPSTEPDPDSKAFIKFFGTASNRSERDLSIADMIAESGCNWACTYPRSKPPRQVDDGDMIYMARMVADDMLIFGKAIGCRHRDDEDMASKAEIKARPWKADWPRYVRVHDGRFIDGTLDCGVSFQEMMQALGPDSFASTQRNLVNGGNTNPFESYNRKAHMMLTARSRDWLDERLEAALLLHGELDLAPSRFRPPSG
ncbi:phospholipase D family protein [Sphingomonas koreensis]|uniref:phospholipase D family protein n=1 Tax=Sphingomonas koreensis TaxID=93064 RepID=UPI00234E7673|nr:phospholipase D-like domain-containing protein [Sphingomonas koreensis]MDC7810935.1 phospholipase D-like domain-containing protein [Sphingomonas koreensis]